ncbi:LuxR family transcriptional regulator [Salinihabitans flavidus]|uniref:LuxR family transcriptional regulator n=1 Tax=Salinihabitans flavidus TaxID=569882 RepID=A0A1H8VA69_9RHOB|nr:LuxR family transcriptional regulator [Salinihabitans flavidus]SEP12362.1 LuxR family transcriptional regulator [Salinihabitans flavidus]
MIFEYLCNLTNAPTLEELWRMHTAKMAEFGFDRLLYGYTNFVSRHSIGDPDDFVVLSNHDRAYVDAFIGDRLYLNAPMVRWALRNHGAQSWRILSEQVKCHALSRAEQEVLEFNRRMGVTAGYTISFNSVSVRAKAAIALTARCGMTQDDVDAIWQKHGDEIVLMNNVAHLKILTLPYTHFKRVLTKRQREVLEWVSDGKTVQDIAVLMQRKPATVEKHLRLAREALNVETTAQAVLKATFQNQIFVLEQ